MLTRRRRLRSAYSRLYSAISRLSAEPAIVLIMRMILSVVARRQVDGRILLGKALSSLTPKSGCDSQDHRNITSVTFITLYNPILHYGADLNQLFSPNLTHSASFCACTTLSHTTLPFTQQSRDRSRVWTAFQNSAPDGIDASRDQ